MKTKTKKVLIKYQCRKCKTIYLGTKRRLKFDGFCDSSCAKEAKLNPEKYGTGLKPFWTEEQDIAIMSWVHNLTWKYLGPTLSGDARLLAEEKLRQIITMRARELNLTHIEILEDLNAKLHNPMKTYPNWLPGPLPEDCNFVQ